jgi:hypothetical protein
MSGTMVLDWLPRTLLGGGCLLLIAWLGMGWLASPARRQRLGEWAMAAALLLALLSLAPAWLIIRLPAPIATPESVAPPATAETKPADPVRVLPPPSADPPAAEESAAAVIPWMFVAAPQDNDAVESLPQAPVNQNPKEEDKSAAIEPTAQGEPIPSRLIAVALGMYFGGGALFLGRWLLGQVVLWRLLRRREPVSPRLAALFESMTSTCHRPRLLLSKRARVPFSCGLFQPTVVLPAAMGESASPHILRWIFAHELTHLRRRDAWSCLLFGLGQMLYFPLPWFWRLRRQVRLCQEYIADAAAAALGCPEDYAQFLLGWTAGPATPANVTGVSGSDSDLFRRITMLLQTPAPVEPRCPRRWSVLAASGLLTLAVFGASLGLAVQAAPTPRQDESKKEEPKKDETKKDETKKEQPAKELKKEPKKDESSDLLDEMLKRMGKNMDPAMAKQMREQMERSLRDMPPEQRKHMREMMQRMGQQRFPVLSPPPGMQPGMMFPGMGGHSLNARLGAQIQTPSATLAEQLDLPKDQGLILRDVSPDSAAAKAGLKPHDVLLELDGKPVPNRPEKLIRMLADIKPDTAVEAVVLRKGKKETIKELKLPEAKPLALDFGFPVGPNIIPIQPGFPQPGANFNPPGFPGAPGGQTVMTTLFHTQDRFTMRHQEGSLVITLTGKTADGKAKVNDIHVQDGRESNKYESVDKVPEQYRDKVKNLIEMSEKSGVRIEIKTP